MPRTATPPLAEIQQPVAGRLEAVVEELRRIIVTDFPRIAEVGDYLLLAQGKMFRPLLLLLADQIEDNPHPRAVTMAAAVELVHLATLVHDDAVDHSVLRRGLPTVNALWNHQSAIIMGDYLYSRSVTELAAIGEIQLIEVLARAANEMSIGEMRQLSAHDALRFGETDYDRLITSKTASLMSAACEMGALAGGGRFRAALTRYGHHLGKAFQVVDDLLDYVETASTTGKPSGQDLREHKMTLPLIAALASMSVEEHRLVERLFADPEPGDDAIARIAAVVRERGGLDQARRRAEELGEAAATDLEALPAGDVRDALEQAVAYVIQRRC
jgi:octaprenyl-diphosphate synthase